MSKETFTFFWSGPFSQWHPSRFTLEGKTYNCAEQYMMAEKARLFKDKESERQIMASTSPAEQKNLGRKVQDFNPEKWDNVAVSVVTKATVAKFTQDEQLKALLLSTLGTTLCEASPYDKIWGIGLAEDDPRAQSRSTWQGKNLLGQILTQVRDKLIEKGTTPRG